MDTQDPIEHRNDKDYGGFWIRLAAFTADMLILFIPVITFSWLWRVSCGYLWMVTFAPVLGPEVYNGSWDATRIMCLTGTAMRLGMCWLYFAGFQSSRWQATVGMKALGLKVIDKAGGRLTFERATVRFFAGIVAMLPVGLGCLMVAWTKRKQGLHDKIAGTYVARTPDDLCK